MHITNRSVKFSHLNLDNIINPSSTTLVDMFPYFIWGFFPLMNCFCQYEYFDTRYSEFCFFSFNTYTVHNIKMDLINSIY